MYFRQVDPKAAKLEAQHNTDGTVTLPTGKLLVVDPSIPQILWDKFGGPQFNKNCVIGEIEYPLSFCPNDTSRCEMGDELKGTSGYMRHVEHGTVETWYHAGCFRPTRKWFTGHVKRVVHFYDGAQLPW